VGGHKATGLHALAVRRNAVARELGAASAARGHHTGIRRQGIGHRAGGRRCRCQDQTHIGVHRLLVRGTQAQLALEGLQLLHEVTFIQTIGFSYILDNFSNLPKIF